MSVGADDPLESGRRSSGIREAEQALLAAQERERRASTMNVSSLVSGEVAESEEMPRTIITRRRLILSAVFIVAIVAFLYFVLPKLGGLKNSWKRIDHGDPVWFAVALVLECGSFAGYVVLFRAVFVRGDETRIGWSASYQITMAGVVATRLFAAGGAGGIALTVWALARSGLARRQVACRMVAFMVLLYAVYMAALVIFGFGLYLGVFEGEAPFAITVVPAILGAVAIAVFLAMSLLPGNFERRLERFSAGRGKVASVARKLAVAPASAAAGVRTAIALLRAKNPGLLGAVAWWFFDIATLWACFHAFGSAPPPAVIIMAYFVGTLANTLPLPGGVGGVEGGMIGAFAAFDVNTGDAVVAVLAYRAFSFWLPMIPGAIAYFQLRKTVRAWEGETTDAHAILSEA